MTIVGTIDNNGELRLVRILKEAVMDTRKKVRSKSCATMSLVELETVAQELGIQESILEMGSRVELCQRIARRLDEQGRLQRI